MVYTSSSSIWNDLRSLVMGGYCKRMSTGVCSFVVLQIMMGFVSLCLNHTAFGNGSIISTYARCVRTCGNHVICHGRRCPALLVKVMLSPGAASRCRTPVPGAAGRMWRTTSTSFIEEDVDAFSFLFYNLWSSKALFVFAGPWYLIIENAVWYNHIIYL